MLDVRGWRSLRSDFLSYAAEHPDRPALVVSGRSWSYGTLADRARRIAAAITDQGASPAERVGVFAYRSETAYAATLGALCGGAAFVPLNRKFPVERTRAMVRRAELDAIVVDAASAAQLPAVLCDLGRRPRIIATEPATAAALSELGVRVDGIADNTIEPLATLPPVLSDDIAYLLFTSGTTGEPKGVGVTHANALHFLDAMAARYRLTPNDRCSQTFDQTFDLAVFDLFMAWSAGACVYAMQPIELLAPVRFVQKHELTLWFSVPSAPAVSMKKAALAAGSMPSLRYTLFCGEPLPDAVVQAWHAAAPASAIDNLYGPTELTIACLAHRWDVDTSPARAVNGIVPIGEPFPGLGALVVDDGLQPVNDGETGELLVCGPQVAPGYWRDPPKTAERFVELPISPNRVKRFYRTGDRVVRTDQGDYAYIGRSDQQIKVLGFRVELGEIEAVLLREEGVAQAAAVGWPTEDGRALGIVAFAVGRELSPDSLLAAAHRTLPPYMVPSQLLLLDAMPLNSNGKIDRKALLGRLASTEQ